MEARPMRRVYRGFRDRSLSVWLAWALGGGKLPDRTKLEQRKFVLPEDPPDDGGRGHRRRAIVFVLLGPVLGVLIALLLMVIATGGPSDPYGYPIVFFFCLIVCPITGMVDGALAYAVPIDARAPLTAIAGGAVAVGLWLLLAVGLTGKQPPPLDTLIPFAIFGALNTGACSLLSHRFRRG